MKAEYWNSQNDPIELVFDLIEKTNTGRKLIEGYNRWNEKCRVKICFKEFPVEIIASLRAIQETPLPVGASFLLTSESGAICYDPSTPVYVLALQVVHELAHALDSSLWFVAMNPEHPKKEEVLRRSEENAYMTQSNFLMEFEATLPGFSFDLKSRYPHSKELHSLRNAQDVSEHYQRQKKSA